MQERQHFAEAIRTKLVREIADLPSEPLMQKVQASPPMNCTTRPGFAPYQGP
jgi:hypothetical protein